MYEVRSRVSLCACMLVAGSCGSDVLIDCLAVINGHMLNMHVVNILTQMWKAI